MTVSAPNCRPSTWNFSKKSEINYTNSLIVRVGEEINLPVYSNFNIDNDFEIIF